MTSYLGGGPRSSVGVACALAICALMMAAGDTAAAAVAFQYGEITEPVVSASFTIDFAAMNAHRWIAGFDINYAYLVDCSPGGELGEYDLSDDLFGAASPPDPPRINMGPFVTDWITVNIDPAFYDALAGGNIGLRAVLTDTVDAMFAMDFISLTVETDTETVVSYYGWPIDNENDGFGIDLVDGGDLPAPLPGSIPIGATGTGFDETVSSVSILAIPEPASLAILIVGGLVLTRRRSH